MLSIAQIYRIGTMFWDDKYGAHGLSPEVITLLQCVTRDTLTFMRVGKGVQGFVSLMPMVRCNTCIYYHVKVKN